MNVPGPGTAELAALEVSAHADSLFASTSPSPRRINTGWPWCCWPKSRVRGTWDAVQQAVLVPLGEWATKGDAWHGQPRTCSRKTRCPGGRQAAGWWRWAGRRTVPLMMLAWSPTKADGSPFRPRRGCGSTGGRAGASGRLSGSWSRSMRWAFRTGRRTLFVPWSLTAIWC